MLAIGGHSDLFPGSMSAVHPRRLSPASRLPGHSDWPRLTQTAVFKTTSRANLKTLGMHRGHDGKGSVGIVAFD